MSVEYKAAKFRDHEEMEAEINKRAVEHWEPLHYAIQGCANINRAMHYVIFVRKSD